MIRVVMDGYTENDMKDLYKAERRRLRCMLIFIGCVLADIFILISLIKLDMFNAGVIRVMKVFMSLILGTGIFMVIGDSRTMLRKYNDKLKTEIILCIFSNTYFQICTIPKSYVTCESSYSIFFIAMGLKYEKTMFNYSIIEKVIEDEKNFYLFIKKGVPFIVRKNSFIEESADDLRNMLQFYLKSDYISKIKNSEDSWK